MSKSKPAKFEPVGHQPGAETLKPNEDARYRAFQANLLSLISHELRTPLTGIQNAVMALEDDPASPQAVDLIKMARRNAARLHQSMAVLLDLAALESGTYTARLREVELVKVVQAALEASERLFADHQFKAKLDITEDEAAVLVDPMKMDRAISLCLQIIVPRLDAVKGLKIKTTAHAVVFSFRLQGKEREKEWDESWTEGIAGFKGGVLAPGSAFGEALQSEQSFLTRSREGLGTEFLLVHEIMRQHLGEVTHARKGADVKLELTLPALDSTQALRTVLASRVFHASTGLGNVALGMFRDLATSPEKLADDIRNCLFRSSDAVYPMQEKKCVALVLDDCRSRDVPRLVERIKLEVGRPLQTGAATCPEDTSDPEKLVVLALKRLDQA